MSLELPLSVWSTAQQTARAQRAGRYLPACRAHPGKMLPAIAQRAIAAYTGPGDLVVDPMCGIGTTLVEAIHLGRSAYGVEYEHAWAQLARANVHHAHADGATGDAHVIVGDARRLADLLAPDVGGRVALVLTSPPYGPVVHGQVSATRGAGVRKTTTATRQIRPTSRTSGLTGSSMRWQCFSRNAKRYCVPAGSSR